MNAIKVRKEELLNKLRTNRADHAEHFTAAAEGYRQKVIEILEQRLVDAKRGKLPALVFNMPMPIDQTKAYDRAIGMLEMSLDDVIELEEHDYQQYVLDDWNWSGTTSTTNSLYAAAKKK